MSSSIVMRRGAHRAWSALLALAIAAVSATSSAGGGPRCVTIYGKTVCGYTCTTAYDHPRCTRTPEGVCMSAAWKSVCWDPPPQVRLYYQDRPPRPECVVAEGRIACGYHCVTSGSRVLCAQTPMGACGTANNRVACADPRLAEFFRPEGTLDAMHCETYGTKVACGYQCARAWGDVRCARSPDGTCSADGDHVVCFDPPPPPPPTETSDG